MRWQVLLLGLVGVACGDNREGTPSDASAACPTVLGTRIGFRPIAYRCGQPGGPATPYCTDGTITLVTSPRNDPRLFALELDGRIRIIEDGQLRADPFLDLSQEPSFVSGGEQGLLGLAFHPDYASNRQFFVFYTAHNPDTTDTSHPFLNVVARYEVSVSDPATAVPVATVLLAILDPNQNHNGGMIEFGRDGMLYIGTGDGPNGNPQDPSDLRGKILRIDVDHPREGSPYGIPADNPYTAGGGAPEVWMLGLRNPWRWSFDRATGDMWIGDVGALMIEELDVLEFGEQAGKNLGWPIYEGRSCFAPPCDPQGLIFPVDERTHTAGWWAIIAGQVYRGSCYPDLVGTYFYTDMGAAQLIRARLQPDGSLDIDPVAVPTPPGPVSLHADANGELYMTHFDGSIYRMVVEP